MTSAAENRPGCALAVFLKYPEPGRVKTRLAATLGDGAAARAYRAMARHTLASLSGWAELHVFATPPGRVADTRNWIVLETGVDLPVHPQSDGDLGDRILAAARKLFAMGAGRVFVVGSDCPALEPRALDEANRLLDAHDCVLGPARDGGYYLIAMRTVADGMLDGVAWSTEGALQQTLAAVGRAGLSAALLGTVLEDVDDEAAWRRALASHRNLSLGSAVPGMIGSAPMEFTKPIRFEPLFFERVWGGRRLEELYGKPLPAERPIGESWEVVDRGEAQSRVLGGEADGLTLHDLWSRHRDDVFGMPQDGAPERFPLLIKLLDAREKLSVQVHPPARVADELGGEPKTEMWHILDADDGADIYAGLRAGATRETFEKALRDGTVDREVHRIPVSAGQTIFIPSGRVHAIGAGTVILEVQQNSDTTYRVFDWNRVGLDGQPRELHVEESMRSIDFDDFEPSMREPDGETLVSDPLFLVERLVVGGSRPAHAVDGRFALFACVRGVVECAGESFGEGDFFLLPASMRGATLVSSEGGAEVVRISLPGNTMYG